MAGEREAHWAHVYSSNAETSVSWYQAEPRVSIEMIGRAASPPARVIDVGGGTSHLVDFLAERGYRAGVLDISDRPLEIVRRRLGGAAAQVEWFVADATEFVSPHRWDVWHDRAVFHFLIDARDRRKYREALLAATASGSQVIIATFGPGGPERCSGLPTMKYSPDELQRELGQEFELVDTEWEDHKTPGGKIQQFVYGRFERRQV
jgi:SAM-dependent methyltransferase